MAHKTPKDNKAMDSKAADDFAQEIIDAVTIADADITPDKEARTILTAIGYQAPVRRGGPRIKFTVEIFISICNMVASGVPVSEACRRHGHKHPTFFKCMKSRDDEKFTLRSYYQDAIEFSAHPEFDAMRVIEKLTLLGKINPNAAKTVLDSMRWRLGRKLPKVYGDKLELNDNRPAQEVKVDLSGIGPEDLRHIIAEGKKNAAA